MPVKNTLLSGGLASSGMNPWTDAGQAESPQPGHQRVSWSEEKSFFVSSATGGVSAEGLTAPSPGWPKPRSPLCLPLLPGKDLLHHVAGEYGQAVDLGEALAVHEELGAQDLRELPHVHLGHEHALVGAEPLLGVGGQRVEVAQVGHRHIGAVLPPDAPGGALDGAVSRAPAEH